MAQKRGHVNITSLKGFGLYTHYDRQFIRDMASLAEALPSKVATSHAIISYNHEVMRQVLIPMAKFIFGKRWRQRLVVHSGHSRGILARLVEFGIPSDHAIGSVLDGDFGQNYFEQWMEERRLLELSRKDHR